MINREMEPQLKNMKIYFLKLLFLTIFFFIANTMSIKDFTSQEDLDSYWTNETSKISNKNLFKNAFLLTQITHHNLK